MPNAASRKQEELNHELRMTSRADLRCAPRNWAVVGIKALFGMANYGARASAPASLGDVPPRVGGERTGTVRELAAGDGCATWLRQAVEVVRVDPQAYGGQAGGQGGAFGGMPNAATETVALPKRVGWKIPSAGRRRMRPGRSRSPERG